LLSKLTEYDAGEFFKSDAKIGFAKPAAYSSENATAPTSSINIVLLAFLHFSAPICTSARLFNMGNSQNSPIGGHFEALFRISYTAN
jgi:hypothetical protein